LLYTDGQVLFADVDPAFLSAGRDKVGGFVQPLFLALGIAAALWYLLEHTPAGRQMYATGSNPEAARLTGIRTEALTVAAFVLAGGLAALAGVVQSARIASGQPDIGASFLLPAFAAAFLGASAIRVGRFNAIGTVLGVLLVATGFSGLVLLGVDLWVQPVFYGAVLLIAIGAPRLAESRSARRRPVEAETT
jgi:ribose transport system permease protein